jgi:hypothetical protein
MSGILLLPRAEASYTEKSLRPLRWVFFYRRDAEDAEK